MFLYFTSQTVGDAHMTEIKVGKLRQPKCHVLMSRDQRKLSRRLTPKIEKERKLVQEIE